MKAARGRRLRGRRRPRASRSGGVTVAPEYHCSNDRRSATTSAPSPTESDSRCIVLSGKTEPGIVARQTLGIAAVHAPRIGGPGGSNARGPNAYSGWTVRRGASAKPCNSVSVRRCSSAGQGRSGFTWSAVTGDTPPQSSIPDREKGPQILAEVGRRLQVHLRGQQHAGQGDRVVEYRGVAGLLGRPSQCPPLAGSSGRSPPARGRGVRGRRQWLPVPRARSTSGLTDSDEDPGGERNRQLSGGLEGQQVAARDPCRVRRGDTPDHPGGSRPSSPATALPFAAAPARRAAARLGWRAAGVRSRRVPGRRCRPGSRRSMRSRAPPAIQRRRRSVLRVPRPV